MSGSRHDWLDDEAAERLLRGGPADAPDASDGGLGAPADRRLDALTVLLGAAAAGAGPVEPEREEAALAAFRRAHPGPSAARSGGTGTAAGRCGRRRGRPRTARTAAVAVIAATALAGSVAAAAVGAIPSPFTGGGPGPRASGPGGPAARTTDRPQAPEPAGSQSDAPTSGAARSLSAQPPVLSAPPVPGIPVPGRGLGPVRTPGSGAPVDPNLMCHDYLAAENGHGRAVQHDALKWLTGKASAAEQSVDDYCRHRLGRAATNSPSWFLAPSSASVPTTTAAVVPAPVPATTPAGPLVPPVAARTPAPAPAPSYAAAADPAGTGTEPPQARGARTAARGGPAAAEGPGRHRRRAATGRTPGG